MENQENPAKSLPPEEMVNASELREFLFCERSWFLSSRGFEISPSARLTRTAGIAFHEARAAAANDGRSPTPYVWALLLAAMAAALLVATILAAGK